MNILLGIKNKYKPVFTLISVGLIIGFFTRILLMATSFGNLSFSIKNLLGMLGIGAAYDFCVLLFIALPLVLYIWLCNETIYKKAVFPALISILCIGVIFSIFKNPIPKEFDKKLPWVFTSLLGLIAIVYYFLFTKTTLYRNKWRNGFVNVLFIALLFLMIFNIFSEFVFWQEFGARYNFIAVDYLVYTHEVIGNIKESYPIGWIIACVVAATAIVYFLIRKKVNGYAYVRQPFLKRTGVTAIYFCMLGAVYFFVKTSYKNISDNDYVNEITGNGVFELVNAYFHNDLNYYKFYNTIADKKAVSILRSSILQRSPTDSFISPESLSIEREVRYQGMPNNKNIVLISVESLSASFMGSFGNTEGITPFLDSLSKKSLFFTNCYATGTRTVRGLEVLSLSIPPIPGQSIIRRPNNDSLFTIASVLKSHGYLAQFLYGGYSSFDNMGPYFKANGYEVIDRSALNPSKIHYANIWGVADEDMFAQALNVIDKDYHLGKPFFTQIMTVSNHRPYTYPEGRINISPTKHERSGAVKYTDYAIGKFITEASNKPWFNNTIFVIVADHCASAAGKQDLPVTGYHIPLLIYSPQNLQPQIENQLVSQLDVVPTILGLLNISYRSKFFGTDILRVPVGKERALVSTYTNLGYIKNGTEIILSPPRKQISYEEDFNTGTGSKIKAPDSLYNEAIAYYQFGYKIFSSKNYTAN